MKLTVVGCSPAWPNPGGAQSGYLVEGRGRLLLDCGPGVLARLRAREAWPLVDAVVVTHFHLDHWGDIVPWVFGAAYGAGQGDGRPELWLPPGGGVTLRAFGVELAFGSRLDDVFELREYEDATPFTAGGFDVTPVRLAHYDELTFGLRVSDGTATVAYSGDTAPTSRLAELARDADLFLCEATLDESDESGETRGHLTADEAVAAFEASGAHRLVVIHRPDELPLDPGLERAHDGLEVQL
ncbi:MAG TPA: MBL fold metallo-hydrolase [Gaiellaceae bacterium]|nr:MBL fold metallo-hydrolase [Gaiellaceae bacterium]